MSLLGGLIEKTKSAITSYLGYAKLTETGIVGSTIRYPKETALIAGSALGVGALGPTTVATGIGKVVSALGVKGTAAVAIGTPIAYGVLKESPKAREVIKSTPEAPSKLAELGGGLGQLIEGEKPLTEFVKEHPVATLGTALVGGLAVAKAIPASGGIILGSMLARDKPEQITTESGIPVDSRKPETLKAVGVGTDITHPKTSASANIIPPGVSTPTAIPISTKSTRKTGVRKKAKPKLKGNMRQTINLRWN